MNSYCKYDYHDVPSIKKEHVPSGVTSVHFSSCLKDVKPLDVSTTDSLLLKGSLIWQRKKYPKGEKLARLLLDVLAKEPGYKEYSEGMPYYHIKFDEQEYYLYFKCITHEGNPYPLEHRRAQLPQKDEFDKIKYDNVPFLFLGYDVDNDVFVC